MGVHRHRLKGVYKMPTPRTSDEMFLFFYILTLYMCTRDLYKSRTVFLFNIIVVIITTNSTNLNSPAITYTELFVLEDLHRCFILL